MTRAVQEAIKLGYRHIDCAYIYGNEDEVGTGLKAKLDDGTVTRDEMWITSKLWNTFHRPDLVRKSLEATLKNLKLDYIDLYLIHWPMAYKEDGELFPKDDKDQVLFSDVDYVDTWREMEKLVAAGLTKSIGVSNFNSKQVERILSIATIKPVTNQVECHPYLAQRKLSAFCRDRGISITSYSPLGSPARPWVTDKEPVLLEEPAIAALATKHGKTKAQILLRWQIQRGHIGIPKSTNSARLAENFSIFDFSLSDADMEEIAKLDRNLRYVAMTG